MRIKSQFIVLASVTGLAITSLVGSLWGYAGAARDVTNAYDQKYRSYLLADGLRQSSDDLTRLVRTYAETGDKSYKDQYNAVVEIRNGKRPRPQDYHRIYWDFVAGGDTKPRPDGPAISTVDLMKQAGFTAEEFALLDEAGKRSDALIKLETDAMNLVDNIPTLGPDAKAKATAMLSSPDYHKFKAEIMKPVDAFFVLASRLGYQWGVIPLDILLVAMLALRRRWRDTVFAVTALVGSALLNVGSKQLFQRQRPGLWESIAPESTFSFPSGHAMGSMTLAAVAVFLAWNTRWRWPALIAAIVFVPCVGLSRVYLGVHYPSDILGGWCAALIWVTGVHALLFRHRWSLPAAGNP